MRLSEIARHHQLSRCTDAHEVFTPPTAIKTAELATKIGGQPQDRRHFTQDDMAHRGEVKAACILVGLFRSSEHFVERNVKPGPSLLAWTGG